MNFMFDSLLFRSHLPYNVLGATDVDYEGTWVWQDGSAWDFESWSTGEPNGGTAENCLEIVPSLPGISWNDVPCDAAHGEKAFVCTYENGIFIIFDLKNIYIIIVGINFSSS